ncbi:hypothetical protein Hanom_Chr01g00038451 [Helianthus anomalus]
MFVFRKTLLDEMSVSFLVPPNHISVEDPSQESQLLHPGGQWLPGAYVNPAGNCLNLNSKRKLSDIAVIWRDEGDDESPVNKMTFENCAQRGWLRMLLKSWLWKKGSVIAIDMPMDVKSGLIRINFYSGVGCFTRFTCRLLTINEDIHKVFLLFFNKTRFAGYTSGVIVGATPNGDRRSCFSYFMNAKAIWWKLCTWLNIRGVASCHSVKDLMLKLESQALKKRKKAIRSNNHWRNSGVEISVMRDMPNEALEEEVRALMSDKYGETEYQESMQSQIDIIKVNMLLNFGWFADYNLNK